MTARKKCVMENCNRDIFYKKSELCAPCYQALWYWKKKSVTQIVQRKSKLRVFMSRMDSVEPSVTVMPSRKRSRK